MKINEIAIDIIKGDIDTRIHSEKLIIDDIDRFRNSFFHALENLNKLYKERYKIDLWNCDYKKLLIKDSKIILDNVKYLDVLQIAVPKESKKKLYNLLNDIEFTFDAKLDDNIVYFGNNKKSVDTIRDKIECIFQYKRSHNRGNKKNNYFQVNFVLIDFENKKIEKKDEFGNTYFETIKEPKLELEFLRFIGYEDLTLGLTTNKHQLNLLKAITYEKSLVEGLFTNGDCENYEKRLLKTNKMPLIIFNKLGLKINFKQLFCDDFPLTKDNNFIFKRIDSDYITDNKEIYKILFGKKENYNALNSFSSILREMKLSYNYTLNKNILKKFIDLEFEKKFLPRIDKKEKSIVFELVRTLFPNEFNELFDYYLEKMEKLYK